MGLLNVEACEVALFGALLAELSKWYNAVHNLDPITWKSLKSGPYWVVTGLMIVATPVGVGLMYHGKVREPWEYVVAGIGFPLLVRSLLKNAATAPAKSATLTGGAPSAGAKLRELFRSQ